MLKHTVAPCQICNNETANLFDSSDSCDLVECSQCGFIWLEPLPTKSTQLEIYNDAYQGLKKGYFGKVTKKMRRSRWRARRLRKLVSKNIQPRFLDVGCSGGFMVEAAREKGFVSTGVELDPKSLLYARQHFPNNYFYQGTIEDFVSTQPDQHFDIVYCSEVIEHVSDVNSFTESLARTLVDGGYLYLTTPDIRHWRRPRDLHSWDGYCPPSHCLYFDRKTINHLLYKHQLRVVLRYMALKPGIKLLAQKRR